MEGQEEGADLWGELWEEESREAQDPLAAEQEGGEETHLDMWGAVQVQVQVCRCRCGCRCSCSGAGAGAGADADTGCKHIFFIIVNAGRVPKPAKNCEALLKDLVMLAFVN